MHVASIGPADFAAAAIVLALVVFPLVIFGVALVRSRMNPVQCILWGVAYSLCKLLWRTTWVNEFPSTGGRGCVVVCNHRSSVDPFFVQCATGRKIHWMVAREYCEHAAFGPLLRTCEVIPVRRGGVDTASTKTAIRYATSGDIVGMLPEGRINMTDKLMLPVRPGAALVALKARVPVVPCYIDGSPYRRYVWSPFLMPARVEIRFGRPIDLAEFYDREREDGALEEIARRMVGGIAELAGQPDFVPQMAGRNWKPSQEELEAAMAAAERRSGRV